MKKFKPVGQYSPKLMMLWIGVFAFIGVGTLLLTMAAPPLVVDTTLPVVTNVNAYGDDRVITVTWNPVDNNSVVGYYLKWKKRGATSWAGVKQTVHAITQIQPVDNNAEYEIEVQSARGTYVSYPNGPLDDYFAEVPSRSSRFARGDGRVSTPVTVHATPNDTRVASMRQRLTGFFDDFNTPANPLNELKWNMATASGVGGLVRGYSGSFINSQFHAHNTIKGGTGGQAMRPRATFDTTGMTETNPASIEFDIDGVSQERDTWYIDIIPLDVRRNRVPLDLTAHISNFDDDDEDPGNMLRINQKSNGIEVAYFDENRNSTHMNIIPRADMPCRNWEGSVIVQFGFCDMSRKTPGIVPAGVKEVTQNFDYPVTANVRRHWVIQMTPTKFKLYIDSVLIGEAAMPAAFTAKRQYTVHSSLFTYSTGKAYNTELAHPYVSMLHWDNFGFTGPAPSTVTYNYLESGPDGNAPAVGDALGTGTLPRGQRATTIRVPDRIGNITDNRGILYFTLQNRGFQDYDWSSNDHILFNGRRYNFPNPLLNMVNPDTTRHTTQPERNHATAMFIDKADIRQGLNNVTLNIGSDAFNVHLELNYLKSDTTKPTYTSPQAIFGQTYSNLVEPPLTNCSSYSFIEQDLGLPYLNNATNLLPSQCVLLAHSVHHNPGEPVEPVPNPVDTTAPQAAITFPAGNASLSTTVNVAASASDNSGAVTRVDFFVDGTKFGVTDISAPFEQPLNTTTLTNASHTLTVRAYDSAGNVGPSPAVVVTVNNVTTPPPVNLSCDFNKDTKVDIRDLVALIGNYGKPVIARANGDCNGDALVDLKDLVILLGAYGK